MQNGLIAVVTDDLRFVKRKYGRVDIQMNIGKAAFTDVFMRRFRRNDDDVALRIGDFHPIKDEPPGSSRAVHQFP